MNETGRESNAGRMRKRRIVSAVAAGMLALLGILLLLYPFISDYVNSRNGDVLIESYERSVDEAGGAAGIEANNGGDASIEANEDGADGEDEADLAERLLQRATVYNEQLFHRDVRLIDTFSAGGTHAASGAEQADDYDSQLAIDDSGMMAYIEIPAIDVCLPVYHGVSDDVLQRAAGHLQGSSLPVGGADTHCVLTGHTGLRNVRLFTDLTSLEEGDCFFVHVLGRDLAYKVDQICVTVPDDVSQLAIREGMDYMTLVTCTPYGVNSHRLLVRGERTDYEQALASLDGEDFALNDSQWLSQYRLALMAGLALVVLITLITALLKRRSRKRSE